MLVERNHGFRYTVIVLLWTWGVLLPPIIFGLDLHNHITLAAYVLAGASPSVLALIFVFTRGDKEYRHIFIKRIIAFKQISAKAYVFLFMFVPAVSLVSLLAQYFITAVPPDWSSWLAHTKDPLGFLLFAASTLVLGPLAEEIGWRGYLFDRLAGKGPLAYGLWIGLIWTIWHLPMFFIDGTYQNGLLERGALPVICFALSTTALGVIMGDLVNRNHKSILAAILFHFMINFIGELVPLTDAGELFQAGVFIAASIFILKLYKRRNGIANFRNITDIRYY